MIRKETLSLSKREKEVLQLSAQGCNNKQVHETTDYYNIEVKYEYKAIDINRLDVHRFSIRIVPEYTE